MWRWRIQTTDHITQIKPGSSYLPLEFEDHFFQAIRLARALCVLVVEPAGNGDLDLDAALAAAPRAPAPGDPCDIMDSGALMVGAAAPDTHCRYASSSYGDVVRGFAWGSNVVTSTAGQGYTELYSDTSSAAAIVAGAAVVAQALALQATGAPMRPDTLRFELNDTGTDSASSADQIGRMPNLRAFADKLGLP